MQRKEVVVGNQVFDLGIKGLEDSVANKDGRLPTMELEVGETIFSAGYVADEKAFTLTWWGSTNSRNIVWARFVFLIPRWPFVKRVSAFTYAIEGV